jgi:hypothetical protein
VIVGRGCLGRPWLFRSSRRLRRSAPPPPPDLGGVIDVLLRHAALLIELFGERSGVARDAQVVRLVPEGLPGQRAGPQRALPRARRWPRCTRSWPRSIARSPYPAAALRARAASAAGRRRSRSRRATSTTSTPTRRACAAAMEAGLGPADGG